MPKFSLNEIDAQCRKAARGAGYAWGLAEEAGKMARFLASYNMPGPQLLADWLYTRETNIEGVKPFEKPGLIEKLCPIYKGALLNDFSNKLFLPFNIGHCCFPLLLAFQFRQMVSRSIYPLIVTWDGGRVIFFPDGNMFCEGEKLFSQISQDVNCDRQEVQDALNTTSQQITGYEIADNKWELLGKFAHRTYVPATEESRRLGAG